jgi:hypothetical protein
VNSNFADASSKTGKSWLVIFFILVGTVVVLAVIQVLQSNFVGGGPSKFDGILNHLRVIDAAKAQWALEHGLTNEILPSRIITTKDLAPYWGHEFTGNDLGDPKYGELYSIRDLNQPCEAVLTKEFSEGKGDLSRGTIIRLYQDPQGDGYEIISADGSSVIYHSVHGVWTITKR